MAIFEFDQPLFEDIAARFDLRPPNKQALRQTIFELSGQEECREVTLDLATGVGKTFILAALLEYAAQMGVKNLLVVLPGKTVRTKTIANFTPGADGFIDGAEIEKVVVTPQNFVHSAGAITDPSTVKLFLMNIHHLTAEDTDEYVVPGKAKSARLRTARPQETLGGPLLDHLKEANDLLMVMDEAHSFTESAATWHAALNRLQPAARVGLTATPVKGDNVIFRYTLPDAVSDEFVKTPVVAIRPDGYRGSQEYGQLKDAKALLEAKTIEYRRFELAYPNVKPVNPVMLVACRDISHASEVTEYLRGLYGRKDAILEVHSESMTDAVEQKLADIQQEDSPVKAIVQVDMLNEGWNVHNVAVLVPLRALDSARLTEQMIGRGLRLPYGKYTGNAWVDSLDILSHLSIKNTLKRYGLEVARNPDKSGTKTEEPSITNVTVIGPAAENEGTPGTASREVATLNGGDSPIEGASGGGEVVDVVVNLGGGVVDLEDIIGDEEGSDVGLPDEAARVELRNSETFRFPMATFRMDLQHLQISNLTNAWTIGEAAKIGEDEHATLDRQTVLFTKDGVKFNDAYTATIIDEEITSEVAAKNITPGVLNLPAVKSGKFANRNLELVPGLVKRFTNAVGGKWTYRRALAAGRKLAEAIRRESETVADSSVEEPAVAPLILPKRRSFFLPTGVEMANYSSVKDNGEGFVRQRYYDGWKAGKYSAAQFDAWATEFRIARLMDRAPNIIWWMRLYTHDGAKIEYGNNRSYYPDFVAQDNDGVFWIIEGKNDAGEDDKQVQAKRAAAEKVIHLMETREEWRNERWGYLISYQSDVAAAQDWGHLFSLSNPVVMTAYII